VSKKSRPSFCLNPCTTSLALCFSIVPSVFNFLLKIHLHPSALHPCDRSTSSHVWFCIMESISLFTASFHEGASGVDMTSLNVFGSFSKRNAVINSSPNDFSLRALLLRLGSSFSSSSVAGTEVLASPSSRIRFGCALSLHGNTFSKKEAFLDSITVFTCISSTSDLCTKNR